MADFTFFRHKGGPTVPIVEIVTFSSHSEAQAYAQRLLINSPVYEHIEFFSDEQPVTIIERRASQPPLTSQKTL